MQAPFLLLSFHMEKQMRAEGSKAKTVLKAGKADTNPEITTIGFLGARGMFVSAFIQGSERWAHCNHLGWDSTLPVRAVVSRCVCAHALLAAAACRWEIAH